MSMSIVLIAGAIFSIITSIVIAAERSSGQTESANSTDYYIALENLATIPPDCSWTVLRCADDE